MTENDAGVDFSESGMLRVQSADLHLNLTLLLRRLGDFLARLDSCERGESGEYRLASTYGGSVGGAKVLWDDVTMLASSTMLLYLRPQRDGGESLDSLEYGPGGVAGFGTTRLVAPRSSLPLHEVIWQLFWSLPSKGGSEGSAWPMVLPADTGPRLRAIERELERYLPVTGARLHDMEPHLNSKDRPGMGGSRQPAEPSPLPTPPTPQDGHLEDLVTLDQAAAMAGESKRTLERALSAGQLPRPVIQGTGGRSSKWRWAELRPALAKHARRPLPAQFPGSRFLPRS